MQDNAYVKSLTFDEWKLQTDAMESSYSYAPIVSDSFSESYQIDDNSKYRVSFDVSELAKYDIEIEGRKISYDREQGSEVLYTELSPKDGELNITVTNKSDKPISFDSISIHKL